MATIHIIGAGIAGLTAASSLARDGHYVQVYEASQAAGGRCKLLQDDTDNSGFDGCNALLFGAHSEVTKLAGALGSGHTLEPMTPAKESFDVKAREYRTRGAFLVPPTAPIADMVQLLGLIQAPERRMLRDVFDYYHPLSESYVEPLSRSLMFVAPEQASARLFARRLAYLLRKGPTGLKLLMPKHSLHHSLVVPALAQIEAEGGAVYYGQQVKRVEFKNGCIGGLDMLKQKKALRDEDKVLITVAPHVLAGMMPGAQGNGEMRDVVSIIYRLPELQEPRMVPLKRGVADWVKVQHGRVVVTAYAPGPHLMQQENQSLARRVWREVAPMLELSPNDMPEARVAKERKAVGGSVHLPTELPENVAFAGEALGPKHMSPLESAIVSGNQAAHKIRMMIAR